ncbi:unnamed protein product [marine sediment metagenome]|uniref:Uncharacterized protein n=1 Tax=marine sediment metagenome TaxID=412755 RepID=X1G9D0_9ZZZZ
MYFEGASTKFNENFNLFGSDPGTQTEKYNLYAGLTDLAEGLKKIRNKLNNIDQRTQYIENRIRYIEKKIKK